MNIFRISVLASLVVVGALAYTNCSKQSNEVSNETAGGMPVPTSASLGDAPKIFKCNENTFLSDSFVAGRINGQNGWESAAGEPFDEEIVNVGASACRGQNVWRISNAYASGGFGNQPRSRMLMKSSGESTLRSPGGGDSMYYEFSFRTKSTSADGSAVDVSFASGPSTDRHDLLRISNASDAAKGLQMIVRDGAALTPHEVMINMTRGVWHHVKAVVTSPDGFSNDVTKIYVDGALAGSYTTWEDYKQGQVPPQPSLAVSRVMFRIPATILVPTAQGFYIDDFQQVSFDSASPTVVIESYETGFEN